MGSWCRFGKAAFYQPASRQLVVATHFFNGDFIDRNDGVK